VVSRFGQMLVMDRVAEHKEMLVQCVGCECKVVYRVSFRKINPKPTGRKAEKFAKISKLRRARSLLGRYWLAVDGR